MAHLQKISMKNFGPFLGETEYVFPKNGLVRVSGLNRETGGSSGAGKSSFLSAIAYAMGYCDIPGSALQAWGTDEKLQVVLDLGVGSTQNVIARGAKTFFRSEGVVTKGAVSVVEEKLRQAVGADPGLLKLLTYRAQKERSQFLQMNDASKKEFLAKVLGLDKLEAAYEESLKQEKLLEGRFSQQQLIVKALPAVPVIPEFQHQDMTASLQKMEELRARVKELDLGIKALNPKIAALLATKAPDSEDVLVLLQERARLLAQKPEQDFAHRDKLSTFEKEIQRRLNLAKEADEVARQRHARDKKECEEEAIKNGRAAAAIPHIKRELELITKAIEEKVCPVCKGNYRDPEVKKVRDAEYNAWMDAREPLVTRQIELEEQLKQAEDAAWLANRFDMALLELGTFEPNPKIAQFQGSLNEVRRQIAVENQRLQNETSNFQLQQQALVSEFDKKVSELRAGLNKTAHAELEGLRVASAGLYEERQRTADALVKVEGALSAYRVEEAAYTNAVKAADTATARQAEEKRRLDEIDRELRAERDFSRFLGREGFLGVIFEEVLKEIEDESNRTLGRIPNTARVSVAFKTETSTQKGTVRKAIVTEFYKNDQKCTQHGISGGMQTVVDLAVDLALLEVVGRRTGVTPGWLILDEAIDGLGVVEKESCLEILQRYAQEKLILVVDHDTAFKEFFAKTIDIVHDGVVSSIQESESSE